MEIQMEEQAKEVKSTKNKNYIALVIIALLVIAVLMGIIFYPSPDKKDEAKNNPDFELTNTDELPLN